MIWLIGNRGMLGKDVEKKLLEGELEYTASDMEVDITDPDALNRYADNNDIDWIINCAAYTAVDKAEDEPDTAFKINAEGVLNIARAARQKNAGIIHISTDYLFDGEKEGEYLETDDPNPMGVYGKSKLAGEENIINTISNYFIIRIAWLFGKYGNNFVYTMLRLFNERNEVRVVSDQWGSPTYTVDLAELIIRIITVDSSDYGIYNFSSEGRTNWHEFAKEIFSISKKYRLTSNEVKLVPISTDEFPTKAKRPVNSCLSKEKIRNTFDIKISSWQDSLDRFLYDLKSTNTG